MALRLNRTATESSTRSFEETPPCAFERSEGTSFHAVAKCAIVRIEGPRYWVIQSGCIRGVFCLLIFPFVRQFLAAPNSDHVLFPQVTCGKTVHQRVGQHELYDSERSKGRLCFPSRSESFLACPQLPKDPEIKANLWGPPKGRSDL